MNKESVQVSSVLTLNWYSALVLLVWMGMIGVLVSKVQTLIGSIVLYAVLVLGFCVISLFVYGRVFMDQVTLSNAGITQKNRVRTRVTPWEEIVQVGYMSDKNPRVMVMLRTGGSKRKKTDSNMLFYLRNTGRLIAIPEQNGVEATVNRCYGPVDFDLSGKQKEI